ncbi:MAG: hypothetical protein AB7G87_03845 [Clostridia bacterium]
MANNGDEKNDKMVIRNNKEDGRDNNFVIIEKDEFREIYEHSHNMVGGSILSQLEMEFRNDILYRKLEEAGLSDYIVTEEMREGLIQNKVYGTPEAARMVGLNDGTLRGWIRGDVSINLPKYIKSTKIGDDFQYKYQLDCAAIYRIRLIYLMQNRLNYPLNQIAAIATGLEMISPSKGKNKLPSEELMELKEQIGRQQEVIDGLVHLFKNIVTHDEDGNIALKTSVVPALEEKNREIEQKITEMESSIENIVENKLQESITDIKKAAEGKVTELEDIIIKMQDELTTRDIKVVNAAKRAMLLSKAKDIALQNRSFIAKLLNKEPTKEEIEKHIKRIENDFNIEVEDE